jgi:hypothetical protein
MKHEILNGIWTSQNQVLKQSKIMEQSIFDRQELSLYVSVLKIKAEPEHPGLPPVKIKVKKTDAMVHEDGESISSHSDATSSEETEDSEDSDDGMDGFVVDDDPESDEGIQLSGKRRLHKGLRHADVTEDEHAGMQYTLILSTSLLREPFIIHWQNMPLSNMELCILGST